MDLISKSAAASPGKRLLTKFRGKGEIIEKNRTINIKKNNDTQ